MKIIRDILEWRGSKFRTEDFELVDAILVSNTKCNRTPLYSPGTAMVNSDSFIVNFIPNFQNKVRTVKLAVPLENIYIEKTKTVAKHNVLNGDEIDIEGVTEIIGDTGDTEVTSFIFSNFSVQEKIVRSVLPKIMKSRKNVFHKTYQTEVLNKNLRCIMVLTSIPQEKSIPIFTENKKDLGFTITARLFRIGTDLTLVLRQTILLTNNSDILSLEGNSICSVDAFGEGGLDKLYEALASFRREPREGKGETSMQSSISHIEYGEEKLIRCGGKESNYCHNINIATGRSRYIQPAYTYPDASCSITSSEGGTYISKVSGGTCISSTILS